MRPRSITTALLLLSLCPAAVTAAPVSVSEYLSLRRKHSAVPVSVSKEQASAYEGRIVEVRGRLAGVSKSDSGEGCLIVTTSDNGSFVITTNQFPPDGTGTQLACLVKVSEPTQTSIGDLKLVAWTYDVDVQRVETAAAAKTAKTKAAQAKAAQTEPARAAKPARGEETSRSQPEGTRQLNAEDYVAIYRKAIKSFNKRLSDKDADTIARSILGFSWKYKLDARLVCAVILAESHFRTNATSHCGAMGLGQLMPGTAAGLGVNNAYDPVQNVYGSVRYIKSMLDRMSGNKQWNELTWHDLGLAIAAYNAGPGAVKKHGGIPPYKETQNYVRRVTQIYKQLCGVK